MTGTPSGPILGCWAPTGDVYRSGNIVAVIDSNAIMPIKNKGERLALRAFMLVIPPDGRYGLRKMAGQSTSPAGCTLNSDVGGTHSSCCKSLMSSVPASGAARQ